jgi:hypothetical protein
MIIFLLPIDKPFELPYSIFKFLFAKLLTHEEDHWKIAPSTNSLI